MPIIYQPKGRALEYAPLAANLYQGCAHGCLYCFGPSMLRCDRQAFYHQVKPRPGVLEQLRRDAMRHCMDAREVLLSFTSDPYQPIEEELELTRGALRILTEANLAILILTKAGLLAARDFDLLGLNPRNFFGVTLTTDLTEESLHWEPKAALPSARIEVLKKAHAAGIRTWVSFEPVINPDAVVRLIETTAPFVDLYKVGKLNYLRPEREIHWGIFYKQVTKKLQQMGKSFIVKNDLLRAARSYLIQNQGAADHSPFESGIYD